VPYLAVSEMDEAAEAKSALILTRHHTDQNKYFQALDEEGMILGAEDSGPRRTLPSMKTFDANSAGDRRQAVVQRAATRRLRAMLAF